MTRSHGVACQACWLVRWVARKFAPAATRRSLVAVRCDLISRCLSIAAPPSPTPPSSERREQGQHRSRTHRCRCAGTSWGCGPATCLRIHWRDTVHSRRRLCRIRGTCPCAVIWLQLADRGHVRRRLGKQDGRLVSAVVQADEVPGLVQDHGANVNLLACALVEAKLEACVVDSDVGVGDPARIGLGVEHGHGDDAAAERPIGRGVDKRDLVAVGPIGAVAVGGGGAPQTGGLRGLPSDVDEAKADCAVGAAAFAALGQRCGGGAALAGDILPLAQCSSDRGGERWVSDAACKPDLSRLYGNGCSSADGDQRIGLPCVVKYCCQAWDGRA